MVKHEKEKIPLLAVYRQDGKLNLTINNDEANIFEIYGFLKIYLNQLEVDLEDKMERSS